MQQPDARPLVKEVEGRLIQNVNELYLLPADKLEHDRLELQNFALFLALEGNYPARDVVQRALLPRTDRRCQLLDIGTGSGSWAEAMAREFPHADVLGVDLVAVARTPQTPPNCRFMMANINDGMPEYHDMFDVVHARSVTSGLTSISGYLDEVAKLLRPGGVHIFADGNLQLYDDSEPPQPLPEGHPSAAQRIFFATRRAMTNRGSQLDARLDIERVMLSNEAQWRGVKSSDLFIPLGNWKEGRDVRESVMASVMGRDAVMTFAAMKPGLSQTLPVDEVDELVRAAQQETETLGARVNSIWHYMWAIRV